MGLPSRRAALVGSAVLVSSAVFAVPSNASAERSLGEYRYFRALSIDLRGRIPSVAEVNEFERDTFDVDAWIDQQLSSPAYSERVRRVYMDALRLQLPATFAYVSRYTYLRRVAIHGPNGKPTFVYFLPTQRRTRVETDGDFCLTNAETGLKVPSDIALTHAKAVPQTVLDANTVSVKPWWLYSDYRAATPTTRYAATWASKHPHFVPSPALLTEPDGTPTTSIRICKEEAQVNTTGTIFVTGRVTAPKAGDPIPYGRTVPLPLDSSYATAHKGERVNCQSTSAQGMTTQCGCGRGLERCLPGVAPGFNPAAFVIPQQAPLGSEEPATEGLDSQTAWERFWWAEEARHFFDYVLSNDNDFRDVLRAKYSLVNGPLARFYKYAAGNACCGNAIAFKLLDPVPLFEPSKIGDIIPYETEKWTFVADRGPRAAGIMTMPIFLLKYGSRRARAHVLYNAFLCHDFVAGNVRLAPSTEQNLMKREGCSTCHETLEPLAAYFARIQESDFTWLPPENLPAVSTACAKADPTTMSSPCRTYYDPAFSGPSGAMLRAAYPSPASADEGPAGLAEKLVASDEFPACVASNMAQSFLGRQLTSEDEPLRVKLSKAFVDGGYKMRSLVRELVKAEAYRDANNLSSKVWRERGGE